MMTREEAIKTLKQIQRLYGGLYATSKSKKAYDAFDMAIEALKADVARWSSWNKTFEQSGITDLISRADAVRVVNEMLGSLGKEVEIKLNCLTGYVSADRKGVSDE